MNTWKNLEEKRPEQEEFGEVRKDTKKETDDIATFNLFILVNNLINKYEI